MAVRSYGPRQIQRAALPGARLTAASTALAEGGNATGGEGLIAIGGAVKQAAGAFTAIAERERDRADDIARLKWQNQFADFENTRINDPEKGSLSLQGEAAFGEPEAVDSEFQTLADGIEGSLVTERQKIQFAKDRLTFGSGVESTVRRHVRDQIQRFQGEQLTARVENARSAIGQHADDPRRIGVELAEGEEAIRKHGPKLGMPPEQVEREVAKFKSASHVDVISNLLESEQTTAARVYFEEAKGEISGDQLDNVKKMLKEGTVRKSAQTETSRILAAGGTFTEQRDAAKKITDPDVQDEVLRRIEHEKAVKENVDRDVDESRMKNAATIIDQTRNLSKIPPADWREMSPSQRSGMRSYLKQITEGADVETDWNTFYSLMRQAGDDPQAFAKINITDSIGKLSKQDREQLAALQLSIRTADTKKADTVLEGFMTNQQVVNDVLLEAGLDPSPAPGNEQVEPVMKLRKEVSRQVAALQAATGKKATNEDVRRISDTLFRKVVAEGSRSWLLGSDVEKSLIELPDADRIGRMTLHDMPPSLRELAEDSLRRNGRVVDDTAVMGLYRRYLIQQLPKTQ